jgi:hypothetical protein
MPIFRIGKNIVLYFDMSNWYFPLCFIYETVGNRHRPWIFKVGFLCLELCVYLNEENHNQVS